MNYLDKILWRALMIEMLLFIVFLFTHWTAHASDYRPRGSANAQAHARKGQKHQRHNPGHKVVKQLTT